MEINKILSSDLLDLLFEDRNKSYGAYELRKTYQKRLSIALMCTAAVALLALGGSLLAGSLKKGSGKIDKEDVVLTEIKQEEEKKPEPPPPPPPKQEPPKVEMTKFTPPKIVKDEEVKKDEMPPVEELKETKIDVVSQEGIKDEGLAPEVVDEGKKVIEEKKEEDDNQIFTKVEVDASFPGGEREWRKYLERKLGDFNPADEGAPEGSYTVYVKFIVDKQGNISEVKAQTKHGYGMEDQAEKVIKSGPKWVPAVQNGRQVNAYRTQPITFIVQAE